jgi:hypothetical protein
MLTIYKYELALGDRVTIPMPVGARPLSVAIQHGRMCLWAMVNTERPKDLATFHVYGTGHSIDADDAPRLVHVATVLDSVFVWHVFWEKPS